jgi:hypothetical protein
MIKFRNILAAALISSIAIGISACSPKVTPEPDHKARTTACLVRSSASISGAPEKQLAVDLVEAKIVYGLAVREIQIDENSFEVSYRLLKALQAGCVLMVSANPEYILPLANFAQGHPNMLVLFVGGEINIVNQPANFRWVSDDIQGGARLAGYFAAGKSEFARVHLYVQGNYFQSKSIRDSFVRGVKDADLESGSATKVFSVKTKELAELVSLGSNEVVTIFGGRSIWQTLPLDQTGGAFLIGADLQLGDTTMAFESRVQVSVERNTSKYLLNAVSSLLDREFASDPLYRKPGALKFNTVELRVTQPDSIAGTLLEALAAYKQELISASNR